MMMMITQQAPFRQGSTFDTGVAVPIQDLETRARAYDTIKDFNETEQLPGKHVKQNYALTSYGPLN